MLLCFNSMLETARQMVHLF